MASGWSQQDVGGMRAALVEAQAASNDDEVPVGAVVMINGKIIAAGRNNSITKSDPSGHAEIVALRAAASIVGNHRMPAATLYVTLEPCVMCTGAIAQARIDRLVFAAYDKKGGALGSVENLADSKALNHRFEINGGLLQDEAQVLLERFFRARR